MTESEVNPGICLQGGGLMPILPHRKVKKGYQMGTAVLRHYCCQEEEAYKQNPC